MKEKGGWFFPNLDSHFAKHTEEYPNTRYQQNSLETAYSLMSNFKTVIDIGANIGLHSVRFAQKFQHVFSFEPVLANFECLEKNVSIFPNVKLYKHGLGEIEKKEIISLPKSWNNCGAFSIVDFKDSQEELINEEIQIKRLDDFNFNCDLIKIDTQGFEMSVIKGGLETIKKNKPVLILEIEFKKNMAKINSLLNPIGYYCVSAVKKDKIWTYKK
jgi:FkbM family methyltransferase